MTWSRITPDWLAPDDGSDWRIGRRIDFDGTKLYTLWRADQFVSEALDYNALMEFADGIRI